ncbi:hypothetical protein WBG78_17655 [Chryseolinea sp. T2]|uniref:hypothetical protein n=1 Tax=Chryseolinea sp. T2 TaxID=3129255 RepID=UPI0030769960
MDTLISEHNLQLWIDKFFGYGTWGANIWLVGYEEGGGDLPEEVAEKTNYFAVHHQQSEQPVLCDLQDLYRNVGYRDEGPKGKSFETLFEYRFGKDALLNGAWKNLIAFTHGYNHHEVPDLLNYQKTSFIDSGDAAMVRFYPLPSPHSHAWYYRWLVVSKPLSYIRDREQYEQHVFPNRMSSIIRQIKKHRPGLVLMYGMTNVQKIKDSFEQELKSIKFRMVKAVKLQIPQHHAAWFGETQVIITTQLPTLRHNRVETGFDWHYFGDLVSSYVPEAAAKRSK